MLLLARKHKRQMVQLSVSINSTIRQKHKLPVQSKLPATKAYLFKMYINYVVVLIP